MRLLGSRIGIWHNFQVCYQEMDNPQKQQVRDEPPLRRDNRVSTPEDWKKYGAWMQKSYEWYAAILKRREEGK